MVLNWGERSRPSVTVKIKEKPAYSALEILLPKLFNKITLDAERQSVILTGRSANELLRITLDDSGSWTTSSFDMENLRNAELSADGKKLLVAISSTSINDMIIELDPDKLAMLDYSSPPHQHYESFDLILPLLDGSTIIVDSDQWPAAYTYPDWNMFSIPSTHHTNVIMSRDRTRFLGGSQSFSTSTYSYEIENGFFNNRNIGNNFFRPLNISMSTNASRIVGYSLVYDRFYKLLGSLTPIISANGIAVAPDGKHVYAARYIDNELKIFRHNIEASTGPYPSDEAPLPIAILEGEYIIDMQISDDGDALFILCGRYQPGAFEATLSTFYVHPLTH